MSRVSGRSDGHGSPTDAFRVLEDAGHVLDESCGSKSAVIRCSYCSWELWRSKADGKRQAATDRGYAVRHLSSRHGIVPADAAGVA